MDFDDEDLEISSKTFHDNNNDRESRGIQPSATMQDSSIFPGRPSTSQRHTFGRQNSGNFYCYKNLECIERCAIQYLLLN